MEDKACSKGKGGRCCWLCAGCNKRLAQDETYACAECVNEWLVYRDPNGDMANEDIQEQ
ncbi:TPA: NinF family protein [Salmonella enterica]|nr:NinF family protein [Salmonella enterica]